MQKSIIGLARARQLTLLGVSFCLASVVLIAKLYQYVSYIELVLPLRYGEYGEGIVWQQTLLIPSGKMYGDINHYPYIVFHYPPFYHLVVRIVSSSGFDMLFVGRAVSTAATGAIVSLVAALTYRAARSALLRSTSFIIAGIVGLSILVHEPIEYWSTMMRVDMLGLALAFGGIFLAVCSRQRPSLIYAATVCFVLAIYTKQTLIAAPVALFTILLCTIPRLACKGLAIGALLGLAFLGLLEWWTDGRFLQHIILYNINSTDITHGFALISEQRREAIFLLLALLSAAVGWLAILREFRAGGWHAVRIRLLRDEHSFIFTAFSLYFALSFPMLLMLFKRGSGENYFVEPMSVGSVLVGQLLISAVRWAKTSPTAIGARISPYVVLGPMLAQAFLVSLPPTRTLTSRETVTGMARLLDIVRSAQKPVLSDDMVTLLRAGKQVPIEPAIFSELARNGMWSEKPLIDIIKAHGFAFVVTANGGLPGHSVYAARYTKQVRKAIELAYPDVMTVNDLFTLHLP